MAQAARQSDLIDDVLRSHEPDHILLQAAWADAASELLDISRPGRLLSRVEGRIRHIALNQVSPLAVPAMPEIGREPVHDEAEDQLIEEAMRHGATGRTGAE